MLNIIEALVHIFSFAMIGGVAGAVGAQSLKYTNLISEDRAKIWALILVVVGLLVGGAYGWHIYLQP
ncbi:hypothetical protein M1O51_03085 [Dehalococcoidia bacterium]|nr:hypothetical protein [Dehalococcoidia bacterium]